MKNALVILAGGKGKRFQKFQSNFKMEMTIINLFLSKLDTDVSINCCIDKR